MTTPPPLIELDRVYRLHDGGSARVVALAGVSLTVAAHQSVALIGPTGSGKSTVLNLVAGLDRATAGSVRVGGIDLSAAGPSTLARHRRDELGIIWQDTARNLIPYLTVGENLELAATGRADRAVVAELLELLELTDRADHRPDQLSGGEQQRVALGAAVVRHPVAIIADEPTSELDAAGAGRLMEYLDRIRERHGTTLLIATHDPAVAAWADVTHTMREGRLFRSQEHAEVGPDGSLDLPHLAAASVCGRAVEIAVEGAELRVRPVPDRTPRRPAPAPRRAPVRAAPLLAANDLRRTYAGPRSVPVLRGVSLSVHAGELLVVEGPSGSGKSTLLACLAGLDRADGGTITWDGRRYDQCSDRELAQLRTRTLALVIQNLGLVPALTALEHVTFQLMLAGRPRAEAEAAGRGWLAAVGLSDRVDHRPAELSGGQRHRVAIARALATEPRVVLADEPTADLDRSGAEAMLDLLRDVCERGGAVVVATHDPAVHDQADRVYALRNGVLVDSG